MCSKSRGVLLLAVGHRYYGQLAFNLALSVKYFDRDASVTVLASDDALAYARTKRKAFDCVAEVPHEVFFVDGKPEVGLLKTRLYALSPYDETIFIDADSILCRPIGDLFGVADFASQCARITEAVYGERSLMHWATEKDVQRAFGISEDFDHQVHSFFMSWRRCERTEGMFALAEAAFWRLHAGAVPAMKRWEGAVPDELCFTIAMRQSNMTQPRVPWGALAVPDLKYDSWEQIYEGHRGLSVPMDTSSFGGTFYTYYENLRAGMYREFGVREQFFLRRKPYFDFSGRRKLCVVLQHHDSEARAGEYAFCLMANLGNRFVDEVHVLVAEGSELATEHPKLRKSALGKARATYEDLFGYCERVLSGCICVVANGDIYFDETVDVLRDDRRLSRHFHCLSKWNVRVGGDPELSSDCFNSQDAWAFLSPLPAFERTFELGKPGCDNRLAYEAEYGGGMTVTNPAGAIRAYHLHLSGARGWHIMKDMLHGMHMYVAPTDSITKVSHKEVRSV